MKEVVVAELIWDEWNVQHIARHNVKPHEVEAILKDKSMRLLKTHSNRMLLLGRSDKRLITAVIAPESNNRYYVVTARDMSRKERRFYRNE